jgi:hypothetical protein
LVASAAAVLVFVSAISSGPQGQPYPIPVVTDGIVLLRHSPEPTLTAAAAGIGAITAPPRQAYSYVEAERWVHSSDGMMPLREKRWRAADGSGREHIAALPAVPQDAFRWSMIGATDFSHATVTDISHGAGSLAPALAEPSTDPGVLRQQLHTIEPATSGPAGVLRAVAALFYAECPPVGIRAAAVQVLASIEGLSINDLAIDTLDRPGIAVTVSTPSSTDTLIISPRDGTVLSWRRTYTYHGSKTAIAEHTVFLACGWTPDTQNPPAT